jgi:ATP-binding cassette subfamily A (ABC1) protein 1
MALFLYNYDTVIYVAYLKLPCNYLFHLFVTNSDYLLLQYGRVLENSDPTLVFAFLLVYSFTTVIKSFLISVFFSKANLAAAAGGIIFFVLYLPYGFIVLWEEKMSALLKALAVSFVSTFNLILTHLLY